MKKKIMLLIIPILLIIAGVILLFAESYVGSVTIPSHSNKIRIVDLSNEEFYKQEIINKILEYLDKNKIVLTNDLTVDLNKIVEDDACTGKVQFKKNNSFYEPVFDVDCSEENVNSSIKFTSYVTDTNSEMIEIKKVEDGYLAFSNINIVYSTDGDKNDINITKYDSNFNKIWSYNYIIDNEDYDYIYDENIETEDEDDEIVVEEEVEEKTENYTSAIRNMIVANGKVFFFIDTYSTKDGSGNSRLLILNNDGTRYKETLFSNYKNSLMKVENTTAVINGNDAIYKYNYETNEVNINECKVSETYYELVGEIDGNYIFNSGVSYDDGKAVGTNSLFMLDSNLKEKKKINISKLVGVSNNHFDYGKIKIYNDRIYIGYETTKSKGDYNVVDYTGILIVDKDLNVINDIKYKGIKLKEYDDKVVETVLDYYVLDNELYVLLSFSDDSYILIDKYDFSGKKLKTSNMIEAHFIGEYGAGYTYSEPEIINYSSSNLTYYSIVKRDDIGNENSVVLKIANVSI